MEQLKKYMDTKINLENMKDADRLEDLGFTCRYLPDPPEDFDEFEFITEIGELKEVALMITVENMEIKKVLFGLVSADDPDDITGLSEEQMSIISAQAGEKLSKFFSYITG